MQEAAPPATARKTLPQLPRRAPPPPVTDADNVAVRAKDSPADAAPVPAANAAAPKAPDAPVSGETLQPPPASPKANKAAASRAPEAPATP
jgi:hypothetical protein